MTKFLGLSPKSMFVCSLFYLLEYCFVSQKESNCRTFKSEHPNMILQKYVLFFHLSINQCYYLHPTLCTFSLTRLTKSKVEGGER
jgi:hypothetical protein